MKLRFFIVLAAILATGSAFAVKSRLDVENNYRALLQSPQKSASDAVPSVQERSQMMAERKRFENAEAIADPTRRERLLVEFLDSFHEPTQRQAARKLAQSQSPGALPALRAALKRNEGKQGALPTTLKLAIAQIETRDLKGEARIEAVAQSISLDMAHLKELFTQVNQSPLTRSGILSESKARVIVDWIVDLMVQSAFRGSDMQKFAKNWSLWPTQKARLEAAMLPEAQGADFLLDWLALGAGFSQDTHQLAEKDLFEQRPHAAERILAKLEDMTTNPQNYAHKAYGDTKGQALVADSERHHAIFWAAAATHDKKMLPLLQKFADGQVPPTDNDAIRQAAKDAIGRINFHQSSPNVPAKP